MQSRSCEDIHTRSRQGKIGANSVYKRKTTIVGIPKNPAFRVSSWDSLIHFRNHNVAFGRALRNLRKTAKLTQEHLGFEAGLDRTYISVLERGERSPTLDTMISLSEVFGLSISELASHIQSQLDEMRDNQDSSGALDR
ncbi:helix-turn-helix domain-containing protein [Pseudomonas aeruginosa]|uniref:helix-turn-helix domain-containing protein n=1 Tax=Pseudomonas TaxID=286 RepID=UPI00125D9541|nr:helix-turn-helix transcriptional regulator [Pseudomonas putida]HDS0928675.1 helix-turn-helix transcriptional regulator [Pseudomonas putida]